MARGYKLYAIWSIRPFPEAWDVHPLNVNEVRVAHELIPRMRGEGYLLGDTQYDSNRLHDLCWSQHHQLIAPRMSTAKGLGHRYQSPRRLHALELLRRTFGQKLLNTPNMLLSNFSSNESRAKTVSKSITLLSSGCMSRRLSKDCSVGSPIQKLIRLLN